MNTPGAKLAESIETDLLELSSSVNAQLNSKADIAAYLSSVELSLGSALHSFKVPMAGQALSLHQIYFLNCYTYALKDKSLPLTVSTLVSIMKSLSPAGKRLTPMLAISMQGFLLSLPLFLFGISRSTLVLGSIMAGAWSFAQPLLISYVFLGDIFADALNFAKQTLNNSAYLQPHVIIFLFSSLVLTKLCLAVLASLVATRNPHSVQRYNEQISSLKKWLSTKISIANKRSNPDIDDHKQHRPLKQNTIQQTSTLSNKDFSSDKFKAIKKTLKDTFQPMMIVSLVLCWVYLYFAKHSLSEKIWLGLRPIATAFIVFYLLNTLPVFKLAHQLLTKIGAKDTAKTLEQLITKITT
jgi:hypothetical protein